MAGIVFNKSVNDSLYKAVDGYLSEIMLDVEKTKTNEDEVLNAIFQVKKSKKSGERVQGVTEFANMAPVAEGGKAVRDEIEQSFGKMVEHEAFMKGFAVTKAMLDDDMLDDASLAAKNFVKSYKRSKLQFATNFLVTEGTTFSYEGKTFDKTTGDGVGLFSTGHKMKRSAGTQSNVFTNAFGTNANMLTRLANIGRNFKNDSGHVMGYTFDTIVIPGNCWELEETIRRIINSTQVVGSSNNDINTQKGRWNLVVNPLWQAASGTAPYIIMSKEANEAFGALRFYDREPLDVRSYVDEETRNLCYTGYTRFSVMPASWRAVIMGGAQAGTTLS